MWYSWIGSRIQNCLTAPANSLSSFWITKSVALAVDEQPIERQPVDERTDNLALQSVRDESGKRNQRLDWSGSCKPGKSQPLVGLAADRVEAAAAAECGDRRFPSTS
jgi:hypothetical protein